ncbi:MAG: FtsW/RodA/SpoVE family cell cycle protein [Caldimonas sp.]
MAAVAGPARTASSAWARLPAWLEALAVLGAIALLMPMFARVAGFDAGRDQRFAERGFRVEGLAGPLLPRICHDHAALADALVRERFCAASALPSSKAGGAGVPPPVADALARDAAAFLAPLDAASGRLAALRRQREGGGDLRTLADAAAAIESDLQPFVDRFQLGNAASAGPAPLACASRWAASAFADPAPSGAAAAARANGLLLLAAALDGRADVEGVAAVVPLPAASAGAPACAQGAEAMLAATAALVADARQSMVQARKNEAMRELLRNAGWQWAGAMLLGFALMRLSRRRIDPGLGVAAALALWAGAAWLARVPWPFAGHGGFDPGRADASFASRPATFVLALLAAAAVVGLVSIVRRGEAALDAAAPLQAMSSRLGYAGLVLATGVGWLLLLDLSAHAHRSNRYLALYHQGHLWLGMLVFSVLLFLRRPLAHGLAWSLSIVGEAARGVASRVGTAGAAALLVLFAAAALLAFGFALANLRQLTSEIGRIWLIVGAAWFFFLRAGPLAERLARSGPAGVAFWRYAWPIVLVVAVLIGAMLVTRDMGPLLIAGYASGAFLAASVAMWWHLRSGRRWSALALAVALFSLWIGAVTWALFALGSVDGVAAERLESRAAPFASANDQLALVTWFQRATPADGFGIGAAPWCGFAANGRCGGVPAQIHSDYTFTAIFGVFGPAAAWAAALGCAVWLHRLIRHHGRVTRGEPRLVARAGWLAHDGQALLSWMAVAWVVRSLCQLAVTVAGNLAVLPLTGVTFPFVSFGMTSLLVNLAFLALAIQLDLPARARDG